MDTLNTRWIGQGPKVDQFEKLFENKFYVKNSVAVNSGTSALKTAYELIGIEQGDEVITTPLTCTATNIPLLQLGAKIVWADIRSENLCIDPRDIMRKITPKTKAIVNVNLGGIENDIGEMPIPIVADSCQALGVFNGDYVTNSFQAIKHITTGDGGMLTVPTEEKLREAKLRRWFGIDRERKLSTNWQSYLERKMTFDIEIVGDKRQMNDIAASMGIAGLKDYDYIIAYRSRLFNLYRQLLKDIDGIRLVDGHRSTYWLCTVLVERRDDFAEMLYEKGVDTNVVQIRNDSYKIFGSRADLPVMDTVEDKYISLPLNMTTSEEEVSYVCNLIRKGWG